MIRFTSFLFTLLLSITLSSAQELYKPRDIQQAYKNGTRSLTGSPGKNYWQNRGKYFIKIKATPPDRTIHGSERITYYNNSPKSLNTLVFRLTANIHKQGAPRLAGVDSTYLTSGVHIDSVSVNGRKVAWDATRSFTVSSLKLPQPLESKDSISISIGWHYDVSLLSNREGMIDSTSYFLAYFYPRVAVFDDYQGWDTFSFMDELEFYNDFNDYVLEVEAPKNYIVWATGRLENAEKVLAPAAYQRFTRSLNSDQVIPVATLADLDRKNVTAQEALNTWRFTAKNVTDVAVGLSDHYLWDASSVLVDPKTKRRASVQAAYSNDALDFRHITKFAAQGIHWLSTKWPGSPYPFHSMTVFQGYAGMEYPMMANDESYKDTVFSKFVAKHEIAHSYMPFYMGINETRFGFMDEGWVTAFEYLFNKDDMPEEQANQFFKEFRVNNWINDPSQTEDLPIITPGPSLSGGSIGNNQYGKPALGYLALKEMLGDDLFKKCLHGFMNTWNGKHPIPWDLFYSFNTTTGKNLNWFWNNWFFSNYYIDLAVSNVKQTQKGNTITIKNVGGLASPFNVNIVYADGSKETSRQSSSIWQTNQRETTLRTKSAKKIMSVEIAGGIFMDADEGNNSWKR